MFEHKVRHGTPISQGQSHVADSLSPGTRVARRPSATSASVSKGFGYVTFGDREGLLQALDMMNNELGGRSVRVEVARARSGDRGGGRRGAWRCWLLLVHIWVLPINLPFSVF